MLAFQFDVHPTLMTVQVDMRRPREINKAVVISFLGISVESAQTLSCYIVYHVDNEIFVIVSGSLFAVTASLAVWKYGGSTTANVLQAVPGSFALSAAVLFSALQLCLSSAIGHSALFQDLEDRCNIKRSKKSYNCNAIKLQVRKRF